MSTTEAGRFTAFGQPDGTSPPGVLLQAVIEAARRLDELSCARVVSNLAAAVHAAQKGGQPLGTLTPAAILVLPDGSVKLMAGTASPHYMAPERLRGGTGDRRTDVFALGVVLWEALAHERLFGGANEGAIKEAVLACEFRPPSELNANVPAELDAICKKALARDPTDRYQSAKVMAAELDAVLDDAGYPESNEPIAKYVAKALAPEPAIAPRLPVLPVSHAPSKPVPLPSVLGMTGDTLPPPAFIARQAGQTAILGSADPPVELGVPATARPGSQPSIVEPPRGPVARAATAPAKSAKTEVIGSLSSAADKSDRPSMAGAVTAFLGSNANRSLEPGAHAALNPVPRGAGAAPVAPSAPPPIVSVAPAAPAPVPSMVPAVASAPVFVPAAAPAPIVPDAAVVPSFAPREMPAIAPPVRAPAPSLAAQSQPPRQLSIANAETITTPQLPSHLSPSPSPAPPPAVQPTPRQLGMPPGMTVTPALPGAALQSADQGLASLEDEHRADPAEVIALPHQKVETAETASASASGGRDVLSGWGWSTGSVEVIDDEDVHDTVRASRKRLLIAIGGALCVVLIIAIVAFAFSGSKQPSEQDERSGAATSSATVPVSPATAAQPEPHAALPIEPAKPAPEPPAPEPAEPPKVEPPSTAPSEAEPPKAAVVVKPPESPKAEPPKAELPKAEPPKAAVAIKPPESPKAEPAKAAVAIKPPELPKAEPARAEPPKKLEPKKLEPKKPPEPKKQPDKTLKRPLPSDKLAKATSKAQPVDPYATAADNPSTDPATAYRTGLQQYARGDTTGALSTLRTSLASNPTFAPTWRGLGLVYEKLGNKGQARSAFKRYLQLAPDAGDADQIRDRLERLGP